MTDARREEIRKRLGLPPPPPPYVPMSPTLVSDAVKWCEREARIGAAVGCLGAACGALVLIVVGAPGVVVALVTFAVGNAAGFAWLKYRMAKHGD